MREIQGEGLDNGFPFMCARNRIEFPLRPQQATRQIWRGGLWKPECSAADSIRYRPPGPSTCEPRACERECRSGREQCKRSEQIRLMAQTWTVAAKHAKVGLTPCTFTTLSLPTAVRKPGITLPACHPPSTRRDLV